MYSRRYPRWRAALRVAALTAGLAQVAPAQAGVHVRSVADSVDIGDLLATYSKAISAPAGSTPEWSTFRSLFLPGARIETVVMDSARGSVWRSQTVDEFITAATPGMHRNGFEEHLLGIRVHVYGPIAHVWSGYEARRGPANAPSRVRGVNSYQLVRLDGRWRIAELLWTNERTAGPLPAEWADTASR